MDTEQEQLARLVGNADLEPVDTAGLLEDSLRASLGGVSSDKVREIESEIRNAGDTVETSQLRKVGSTKKIALSSSASLEKLLLALYDVREGLVQSFETCTINSKTAPILADQINRLASCIRYIGGEADEFIPLNHVSGLSTPNFYKNAQKVIETTMQCYSLGEVDDAQVEENGKKIKIAFSGSDGKKVYKAVGTVSSDEWTGNEAIDYIYTPNEGKMSVKAFENGRWIDKSSSGKYQVYWELEEADISPVVKKSHALNAPTEKPAIMPQTTKQEVTEGNQNINPEENSGEGDIGNPIH